MAFRIDQDFENHLPRISAEQYAELSAMIELDGPRPGSLVVANLRGDHILLDGHSTFKICTAKKLKLPAPVVIKFPDRQAALEWIEKNQRSRRNMSREEIARLVAARRARVAEAVQKGESTRDIGAKEGVSHMTIQRDKKAATVTPVTVTQSSPRRSKSATRRGQNNVPALKNGQVKPTAKEAHEHNGRVMKTLDRTGKTNWPEFRAVQWRVDQTSLAIKDFFARYKQEP